MKIAILDLSFIKKELGKTVFRKRDIGNEFFPLIPLIQSSVQTEVLVEVTYHRKGSYE